MITADWKTDAELLLRAIDPGSTTPLYIFDMHDPLVLDPVVAKPGPSPAKYALGFTSSLLDLQLRAGLRARGLWRGRGFGTLIDASGIERLYNSIGLPPLDLRRNLLGIVLHEYAHFVSGALPVREEEADQILARSPAARETLTMPLGAGLMREPAVPWHHHDHHFGRAAIHAWYRADRLRPQLDLHPNEVWSARSSYRLCSVMDYIEALADEPRARAHEPLQSILSSPPPAAYREFGEQDIQRAAATLAASHEHEAQMEEVS
jgi:hypothetical protein